MQGSCNRFVSLDDVLCLMSDVAGLIAAKSCLEDMESGRFGGFAAIRCAAGWTVWMLS